jgi:hypothetical protein
VPASNVSLLLRLSDVFEPGFDIYHVAYVFLRRNLPPLASAELGSITLQPEQAVVSFDWCIGKDVCPLLG